MPRYLVVANLTLGGQALLEVLQDRVATGDARLHVLVPASHSPDGWGSHDDKTDTDAARERLDQAMQRFQSLGAVEVTGQIGTSRPSDVIGDVLRQNSDDAFDEIILSTLPAGPSRWLAMDLPSKVRRSHDVPLTHVEARGD